MKAVLLLVCCVEGWDKEGDQMLFVHIMECILPSNAANDALGCVCLPRAAAKSGENKTDVDGLERENNCIAVRE